MTEETGDADYMEDNDSAYYPRGGPLSSKYYTITRTTSAVGKKQNDTIPYENAKRAVNSLFANAPKLFGVLTTNNGGLTLFDKTVSQELDQINGKYTVIQNYKAFSGEPTQNFTHNYTISNTLDSQFKRTATINGTLRGFTPIPDDQVSLLSGYPTPVQSTGVVATGIPSRGYVEVSGGFNREITQSGNYSSASIQSIASNQLNINRIYSRVLNAINFPSGLYGGYITKYDATQSYPDFKLYQDNLNHNPKTNRIEWLHPVPLSFTTDHNINEGTISYSCAFDNRPLNLIPGAITETLAVSDKYPTTGYASQNIMYRGAMMQNLGTTTVPSRTVSYNATFPSLVVGDEINNSTVLSIQEYDNDKVNNIFKQFDPGEAQDLFYSWIVDDQVNANLIEGSFSKTRTWNYTYYKWGFDF
jgi:hypothetical protein